LRAIRTTNRLNCEFSTCNVRTL